VEDYSGITMPTLYEMQRCLPQYTLRWSM